MTDTRPGPGARYRGLISSRITSSSRPAFAPAICGSRCAAASGVSGKGLVSIKASRDRRPGASRAISIATIPPIDRPARANRSGAAARTASAISVIVSPAVIVATCTARVAENAVTCA